MSSESSQSNNPAILRMVYVAITAACLLSLTYINPRPSVIDLTRFQPWSGGDKEAGLPADRLPFSQWYGDGPATDIPSPSFAGYENLESSKEETGPDIEDHAAENEDEDEDEDEILAPPPVAAVQKAVLVPSSTTDQDANIPQTPSILINPKEYEGITGEIEDPTGKSMEHFYQALHRTAKGEAGAITRIGHWGASVLGADGMTSRVRQKLQAQFGSAGRGWVNGAKGSKWYFPKDVVYRATGWSNRPVAKGQLTPGYYGYGGAAGLSWAGAKTTYRVYSNIFELYHRATKSGGNISIKVDGGEPEILATRTEIGEDRFHRIVVDGDGEHSFAIRAAGKGQAHVYGATMEMDKPGIIYDCIAMIGTRSSRLLKYDPDHLKGQIAHRKPDLMVLMYGGNESVDKSTNIAVYKEKYRQGIRNFRAGRPEASCLIMTPADHRERYRGVYITSRNFKRIIKAQEELATEEGCAYFDLFQAMGGDGSITQWRKNGWVSGDYIHMNKGGSKALGDIFYKALMKGFSDWLKKEDAAKSKVPADSNPAPSPSTKTPSKAPDLPKDP